jgi:hypothetical protein
MTVSITGSTMVLAEGIEVRSGTCASVCVVSKLVNVKSMVSCNKIKFLGLAWKKNTDKIFEFLRNLGYLRRWD